MMEGSHPIGYTLNFSQPLTSLSFTRVQEQDSGGGGSSFPDWNCTVYEGSTVLGFVGEGMFSMWGGIHPAQTYSFTGPGITAMTMYGNDHGFSGTRIVGIDDIVMTAPASGSTPSGNSTSAVPETSTWVMGAMVTVGFGAVLFRRRRQRELN